MRILHEQVEREFRVAAQNRIPFAQKILIACVAEILDEMAAERSITSFTSRAWPIASAAMSTCGGADTSQFDPATMESRLVPGLFAIGDVLDVDGNTGGYSLTFAFASAYAAYRAIAGSR